MEIRGDSFATEAYLPEGYLGLVRLVHEGMDSSRVDSRHVRLLLDHDPGRPVGTVTRVWWDASTEKYRFDADVPDAAYNEWYRMQYADGVRGDISVGYWITDLRFVEAGPTWDEDKFDAHWAVLEISDSTVPMDVGAGAGRETPDGWISYRSGVNSGQVHKDVLARAMKQRSLYHRLMERLG